MFRYSIVRMDSVVLKSFLVERYPASCLWLCFACVVRLGTEEFLGGKISCIMSVTVFCLCGYYTNNLFTVLWSVPFPVPHRRARAVCADTGRNGGDCHCHSWWLVSGRGCRRLLHGSNIQLFHQGVLPWWVSTGFQAIHALLLLCKFPWVRRKEACCIGVYLWSLLGCGVMCCFSVKFIKYRHNGIALKFVFIFYCENY